MEGSLQIVCALIFTETLIMKITNFSNEDKDKNGQKWTINWDVSAGFNPDNYVTS